MTRSAATERQKKAVYDYATVQFDRQKKLFEAGIISRDVFDQAQQAYDNSKADYESAVASRKTQEEQLAYYTIRAPFDGVIGDIPVHVGDYVSSSTMLTTRGREQGSGSVHLTFRPSGRRRFGWDSKWT